MSEEGYNSVYKKDGCQEGRHCTLFGEPVFFVKTQSVLWGSRDRHDRRLLLSRTLRFL